MTFEPLNQAIKSFCRHDQSIKAFFGDDQAIKADFHRSRFLIPIAREASMIDRATCITSCKMSDSHACARSGRPELEAPRPAP